MTFAQPFSGYEILDRVGAGAMGTVFKARHRELGKIVALKVLRPSLARNERYVERLRREARIVAALDHPNIVAGYDLGEEGGYHFFVMEYVESRSLKELLAEWGVFPSSQVLEVGLQVAEALNHAFERGVIHRDIKPGNILIDHDNVVKLTDMGLAKGPADVTITRDGATVGTPQYISPEQARDPQSADVRSDLYSLGATLYHMATGSPPFAGDTMAVVLTKVLNDRAPSVSDANPLIDAGLSLVIRKLLTKQPDLRYQTPADLLSDLRRVQREEQPRVDVRELERADRLARRPSPWADRRLWLAGAAAVLALLGVLWAALPGAGVDGHAPAIRTDAAAGDLLSRLRDAPDLRARIALLRQAPYAPATADTAMQLLRPELDAFVERYVGGARREAARAWLNDPAHWRTPERFLDAVVPEALAADLGITAPQLPAPARQGLAAALEPLRRQIDAWQEQRDQGLRDRLVNHLRNDVTRAWTAALDRHDFSEAERALRASVEGFFGSDGRPSLGQLPPALRAWGDAQCRAAVEAGLARIDAEEARVGADLLAEVEGAVEALELKLRDPRTPASRVRELFALLKRDLEALPPEAAFRAARTPWRQARAALAAFARELQRAAVEEEAARLDQAVARAYLTLLVTGDPDDAAAWLAPLELADDANRVTRTRHVALFGAARRAALLVGARVLGGQERRRLQLRAAGVLAATETPHDLAVELRREQSWLALELDGTARSLAEISWVDLLRVAALPQGAAEDIEAGLALWLLASDHPAQAMQRLTAEARAFFAQHVAPPLDLARARRRRTRRSELDLLRDLRSAYEQRSFERLTASLATYETSADGAPADDAFLREVRAWLLAEEDRRKTARQLGAATPRGTDVVVAEDGGVTLTYDLVSLAATQALPEGWSEGGGELAFTAQHVELGEASRQLELRSAPGHRELELRARLRFPELPDHPRVYLFGVREVWVAVAVLRDGAVAATVISAGGLARGAELRQQLGAAVDQAARTEAPTLVVPGAAHEVGVRLEGARRLVVAVTLDGVEIARGVLTRMPRAPDRVVFRPLQPMSVVTLRVRGS
ncbi:MAG: protein kinase [Planctomycetota bacterium]